MFNLKPESWLNPPPIYFYYKNPVGKAKSGNEHMLLGGIIIVLNINLLDWRVKATYNPENALQNLFFKIFRSHLRNKVFINKIYTN